MKLMSVSPSLVSVIIGAECDTAVVLTLQHSMQHPALLGAPMSLSTAT